jgi:hypothetical protein
MQDIAAVPHDRVKALRAACVVDLCRCWMPLQHMLQQ